MSGGGMKSRTDPHTESVVEVVLLVLLVCAFIVFSVMRGAVDVLVGALVVP